MVRYIYFFLLYLPVCYASPVTNIELLRQFISVDEAEPWDGDSSWQANTAEGWGLPDNTNRYADSPSLGLYVQHDRLSLTYCRTIPDRFSASVQSVDFYFGAPSTEYILKRSFVTNVTSDGLEVRVIRTPWPMVVGQAIFSLIMAWFGLKPGGDSLENPPLYKQIIWVANILRAIAAAVSMAIDLAIGERDVPSVGVAIIFGTVLGNSYQVDTGIMARFASYVGIFISIVGTLLYIAIGILAWVSNGFLTPCPSAGISSNCANVTYTTTQDIVPCPPIMWQQTGGDWEYLGAWLAGAWWYGLFIMLLLLPNLRTCQFFGSNPKGWARWVKRVNFHGMVLGGLCACISAVLNAIFPSPSSASGFWDLWAQNKARVVELLFTW